MLQITYIHTPPIYQLRGSIISYMWIQIEVPSEPISPDYYYNLTLINFILSILSMKLPNILMVLQ